MNKTLLQLYLMLLEKLLILEHVTNSWGDGYFLPGLECLLSILDCSIKLRLGGLRNLSNNLLGCLWYVQSASVFLIYHLLDWQHRRWGDPVIQPIDHWWSSCTILIMMVKYFCCRSDEIRVNECWTIRLTDLANLLLTACVSIRYLNII